MKVPSLRSRLRWLIVGVLAAVLLPLGVLSFRHTLEEVDELSDGRLAQSARTLEVLIQHARLDALRGHDAGSMEVPIGMKHAHPLMAGHTYESEVGFQVFDGSGRTVLATTNLASLPPPSAGDAGFRDVRQKRHRWRLFTMIDAASGITIRAAERYDSRNEITRALWLEHGLPLLVGLPLLAWLLGWAVKRGLQPLERLAQMLSLRKPGSHEPVVLENAPQELQPALDALNEQLARLEDALERERRFSADVAHELRTPLASAMINLEDAMAVRDPGEAHGTLVGAQHALAGLARRIEQLLALARLESGSASGQRRAVDLVAIALEVIEELAPAISESGVELSVSCLHEHLIVHGYEAALAALLRNLLENALRHVPAGGQVQLSIVQGMHEALLDVIDDGPGIPAERRAQVFARFHRESSSRGDGYGLGLSIVQRAAELHEASIELLDSPFGHGLRVHVAIPLRG